MILDFWSCFGSVCIHTGKIAPEFYIWFKVRPPLLWGLWPVCVSSLAECDYICSYQTKLTVPRRRASFSSFKWTKAYSSEGTLVLILITYYWSLPLTIGKQSGNRKYVNESEAAKQIHSRKHFYKCLKGTRVEPILVTAYVFVSAGKWDDQKYWLVSFWVFTVCRWILNWQMLKC